MDKKTRRLRRARRNRAKAEKLGAYRLTVYKSPRHIYAQIITPGQSKVVASASTVEKDLRADVSYGGNVKAAEAVGKVIAERGKAAGVEQVAFDRSGFKYHGRIKALADAAREHGLKF